MLSSDNLIIMGWLLLAGMASFALTGLLRRYALKKSLLDIPNARSSHSVPTPRGGGVAIVLVVLIGSSLLFRWWDFLPSMELWVVLGAGGLVALVGWMDDHGHVAARWRLLAHFVAASWALMWLGGMPPLALFGETLNLGWLGHALAAVYLVWLLNLYNFMDGIDGIAGIEAVTVCLGGSVLYFLSSTGTREWLLPVVLAVAVIGFLFWNFPKAKIFMGDAASGFIGILLGIFSIQAAWVAPEFFWGWVILLGVFVVDATVTLMQRVLRGERFYEAHRSHAYQYAARRWGHVYVTVSVAIINMLWLLPIAYLAVKFSGWGAVLMILAFIPLIVIAINLRAGQPEGATA